MIKITVLVLVLIALSWAQDDVENEWASFKQKHGKNYQGAEEVARKKLFAVTHAQIKAHNSKNSGYQMGHNEFSDMTSEEKKQRLGVNKPASVREVSNFVAIQDRQLPASLDYRNHTCLAPVKNQGNCGSCWAFTAIAPLEFSRCIKTGNGVVLSEQQLVDCDTSNGGCKGGWYTSAWSYLKAGSATSSSYAYTATKSTCKYSATMSAASVSISYYVASNNPAAMQWALVNIGPLAVAINVVSTFYGYKTGVYSDPTCTGTNGAVNHGVVVVGYNTDPVGVPYWIVRNSWGSGWGASGYILIERGVNMCNIERYPECVVSL